MSYFKRSASLFVALSSTIVLSSLAWSSVSMAATCKKGELERTVTVKVDVEGKKAPCRVEYVKDTRQAADVKALFSAQNDGSYCETKAKEFTEKLVSQGWTCE